MRLHIADETGEVLYCPECERELWPAYWTDDGLEVGYWADFAPEEGQAGLLVCGNPACSYEEAVTFTDNPDDAVVLHAEHTWDEFQDEIGWGWPRTWLQEYTQEIERLLAESGQAKLQSLLAWLEQHIEGRQERVDRWLAEAEAGGYPVTFHAEEEKLEGQILASHGDELVLQPPDGEVRVLPKQVVWQERIVYPRKPRQERKHEGPLFFSVKNPEFIVVEGYHLGYWLPNEPGGYHRGRCWDPVAAAALRLREVVPGYWEGYFRAEEIERYYLRREYVKIRGYWLRESGRNDKRGLISVQTTDPEVAKALDMGPLYSIEGGEFGGRDGEIYGYGEYFSLDEVEETRWEEEVEPLPTDHL